MTRLLVLVALAVALWMFLEIAWARVKRALGEGRPQKPMTLMRCAGCGVHVPGGRLVAGRCERCRLQPGVETPG